MSIQEERHEESKISSSHNSLISLTALNLSPPRVNPRINLEGQNLNINNRMDLNGAEINNTNNPHEPEEDLVVDNEIIIARVPSKLELWLQKISPTIKKLYVYGIVNVVCFSLVIVMLIIAYQNQNHSFHNINSLQSLFHTTKLVTDIYLVTSFDICDLPYEKPNFGYWSGYNAGCFCGGSNSDYNGTCSLNDVTLNNCTNIGPFSGFPLKIWDKEIFCLRRSPHYLSSYFNGLYTMNNGSIGCSNQNQKPCIVSNNNNTICIDKYEFCPLTQILVQNNSFLNSSDYNSENWSSIENMTNAKILLLKSDDYSANGILSLIIQYANCSTGNFEPFINYSGIACDTASTLETIELSDEFTVANQNQVLPQNLTNLQLISQPMGFYSQKADFLSYCDFSVQFNPATVDSVISSWSDVNNFMFYNIIAILALLFLNVTRTALTVYIRRQNPTDNRNKRNLARFIELTSFLVNNPCIFAFYELVALIFILSWDFNVLRATSSKIDNWGTVNCSTLDVKTEAGNMYGYLISIQMFNIIFIGVLLGMGFVEWVLRNVKLVEEIELDSDNEMLGRRRRRRHHRQSSNLSESGVVSAIYGSG